MEMEQSAAREFLLDYEENSAAYYPEEFLQKYEPIECFANNQMGETLLVKDHSNRPYIAKCYTDSSLLSKTTEGELLKSLRHSGLPSFIEEIRGQNMICVVRQYVRGVPLNRLRERLTREQAVALAIQLCGVLRYLHEQTPPVIHRDIKPQNIILGDDGQITLIDFGISRYYDKNAHSDTVCFGTQEFAPPEQYGFSQTDCRADIFSLGVLLGWMLTGQTSDFVIPDKRLAHIVKKCTAFSPKDRYSSVAAVRRALLNADGHVEKAIARTATAAVFSLGLLAGGFALGRYTEVRPPLFYQTGPTVIQDSMLEAAIRTELNLPQGEALTGDELASVTELYVYGDHTAANIDDFNVLRNDVFSGATVIGTDAVGSLTDLTKLPNLVQLSLSETDAIDLSPLAGLTQLQSLELFYSPATDFSPIASLPNLRHLVIQDCDYITDLSFLPSCKNVRELVLIGDGRIEDYSALAGMRELQYLHLEGVDPDLFLPYLSGKIIQQLKIGWHPMTSLAALAQIQELEELICNGIDFDSLSGGEQLTALERLTIKAADGQTDMDLSPLLLLPKLRTLTLSENLRQVAETALANAPFEIKYE
jgi:tRNA A-37 threonylcarbamoyl transferase component Bud32